MKNARLRIVFAFARLLGVPIKVREEYFLGKDEPMCGNAQSSSFLSTSKES